MPKRATQTPDIEEILRKMHPTRHHSRGAGELPSRAEDQTHDALESFSEKSRALFEERAAAMETRFRERSSETREALEGFRDIREELMHSFEALHRTTPRREALGPPDLYRLLNDHEDSDER